MADRFDETLPRPEHPRPDLHRGLRPGIDWLNLNGTWRFRFDPEDRGREDDWPSADETAFDRSIVVPFPWESHLAWGEGDLAGNANWFSPHAYIEPDEVTLDNYREAPRHTIGWYRRTIRVPEQWRDRHVWLNIGAADWAVEIWVNGEQVGEAESGYLPVSFDLTESLQPGENALIVRVEDPQGESRKPLGKQVPNWYTPTSGIWQSVWLEPRPEEHLCAVRVEPSLAEQRAIVHVEAQASDGTVVRADVRASSGRQAGCATASLADGTARLELQIPDPIPWTPDSPHMYRLQITLERDGERIDRLHTQFGMRDIDVGPLSGDGPNWIRLNGEPTYLRGALDQSFHPAGVYTHPSNASIRGDMLLAKQAGLNFLRLHIKTPDPRYCYWADRVGILLMCDVPNLGYDGYSELGKERWERTAWGQIRRDFNHPSIFAWCLFNETWGLGGRDYAEMPDRQAWVRACYERAKALDPTRLVEDNSPCLYDHVVTDINSWHFYINDPADAREHIENVVKQTYPGSEFNYVGGNTQDDSPLMNSEYGGISARMGDLDVSWCLLFLTNELRRHEKICGYVYTELTDIEWEHNGLYDYDRSPKVFGYDPAMILGRRFVGFDGPPGRTVEPGADVTIPVFLRPSAESGQLADRVTWQARFIDGLGRERVIARNQPLGGSAESGHQINLTLPDTPGLTRVEALLCDQSGREEALNFCFFEAVPEKVVPQVETEPLGVTCPLDEWAASFDGEVERGEVDGCVQLLAGRGNGEMSCGFVLPEEIDPGRISAVQLVLELSSARPGAPQTGGEPWPSTVDIEIAGVEAARGVRLIDQPADSRGALSHMHGFQGRYGQLVQARVGADAVLNALESGIAEVRLRVRDSAPGRGGLTLYGSRAGRYPCAPTLVIAMTR